MKLAYFFLGCYNLGVLVTSLKMCTAPTHLTSTQKDVQLPDVQIEVIKTEGIITCAKQCLLRRRCLSFNFNTLSGDCQLNRRTLDPSLPSDDQLKPAANFLFSDVSNWPQKVAGTCAHHDCPTNSVCVPGDGSFVCRPAWCLGSPRLDNGTFNSEPKPGDEISIGVSLSYTCDPGHITEGQVICQDNGSRSVGRCQLISSCAMVKKCRPDSEDGEYWLHLSNFNNYRAPIYCHNMVSASPLEYLTLHYSNYGIYPQLSNIFCLREQEYLVNDCAGSGGEVWFNKIRVNITTMKVQINDKTFANITNYQFSYGVAVDCYSAHINNIVSSCGTVGRFTIDLRLTGWNVQPGQQWEADGWTAIVEKVLFNDNRTVVNLHCGGRKGGCVPTGGLFLKPFPQGIANILPSELICG